MEELKLYVEALRRENVYFKTQLQMHRERHHGTAPSAHPAPSALPRGSLVHLSHDTHNSWEEDASHETFPHVPSECDIDGEEYSTWTQPMHKRPARKSSLKPRMRTKSAKKEKRQTLDTYTVALPQPITPLSL